MSSSSDDLSHEADIGVTDISTESNNPIPINHNGDKVHSIDNTNDEATNDEATNDGATNNEVTNDEAANDGATNNEVTNDEAANDEALIENLSTQLSTDSTDEAAPPEPPKEPPLPTPTECIQKHLSSSLLQKMNSRTDQELETLFKVYSIDVMAVATEKLQRAIIPHKTNLQMMQHCKPKHGTRAQQAGWEKAFQNMFKMYDQANKAYKDQHDEFTSVVRNFLNALEDHEQRSRQALARERKPFSKGKRKHFWTAVESDDDTTLLKTLDDELTVQQARWGVFRPSKDPDAILERSLLCLLAGNKRGVPASGAVKCIQALLQNYPQCFSKDDAQEALKFMTERGLHETRHECVNLLNGI